MFLIPPSASDMSELQPLADAIDTLSEILDGDRKTLIEDLTDIVRRRAVFEELKQHLSRNLDHD